MAKTSTVPRETPDDVPDPRIALAAAIERHAAAAARCKQVTEAQ